MIEMEKRNMSKSPKKQQNIVFKQLWIILLKILPSWKDHLFIVQSETVIGWHRHAFKTHWKRKSKRMGRPSISQDTISLIEKLHKENLTLSPEKLHEQLKL
ncbi:hypothetical protein [Jeotgalibacillus salarius]|uniref:Uncharacterized protein n=1 Tax=Jeotgalibacillus salarius TaxID=546023 RepID=A0A4Y8LLZ7_9BACL|nr:hypothetical protein [Jeotgalibacillus salarius]TFE04058.1 hypothetical protein E2626_01645 [Jeotgalibacillus salarius]